MSAIPRSRQKKFTIRSDKAAKLLTEMARDGRTKVSIIEGALRRAVIEAGLPLD